jgi:hypothetical protein
MRLFARGAARDDAPMPQVLAAMFIAMYDAAGEKP